MDDAMLWTKTKDGAFIPLSEATEPETYIDLDGVRRIVLYIRPENVHYITDLTTPIDTITDYCGKHVEGRRSIGLDEPPKS